MRWLFLFAVLLGWSCGVRSFEQVTERHDNGNVRKVETRSVKDGAVRQVRTFHFNNMRDSLVHYRANLPHGKFKTWSNSGTLVSSGTYAQGQLHGKLKTWYPNGRLESQVNMDAGQRQGKLQVFFANGAVQVEEHYRQGDSTGLWVRYYTPQQLQEQNSCHRANEQGFIKRWSPAGVLLYEATCRYGVKHGVESIYYPWSGAVQQCNNWERGERHGSVVYYLGDGTATQFKFDHGSGTISTALAETTWVKGQIEGPLQHFNPAKSVLTRETWQKGQLLQRRTFWVDSLTSDTVLTSVGYWEQGRRHGPWLSWYINGQRQDSLNYEQGELRGRQFHYDRQGHLYMIKRHAGIKGQVVVEYLNPQPAEVGHE